MRSTEVGSNSCSSSSGRFRCFPKPNLFERLDRFAATGELAHSLRDLAEAFRRDPLPHELELWREVGWPSASHPSA